MTDHAEEIKMREFTRNVIRLEVQVSTDQQQEIPGRSREVSMNGLYVMCCDTLEPGTECTVTITLNDGTTRITSTGNVINVHDSGMGIAFDEMDPESFQHLRKLVLLNAPDPDIVEAELGNHVGFKARID